MRKKVAITLMSVGVICIAFAMGLLFYNNYENKKAHESITTPHCRIKCAGCGSNKLNGGKCDAMRQNMV